MVEKPGPEQPVERVPSTREMLAKLGMSIFEELQNERTRADVSTSQHRDNVIDNIPNGHDFD